MDIYSPLEIIKAEIVQRVESGYEASELEKWFIEKTDLTISDVAVAYDVAQSLARLPAWKYVEPNDLEKIRSESTLDNISSSSSLVTKSYSDHIKGAIIGRCAGCTLGRPLEMNWSYKEVEYYLRLANAYPLTDFVPLLDPMPKDVSLCPWGRVKETTLGNITKMVPDDDTDYTIANLVIFENYGVNFTTDDIAKFWLENFPFWRVHTAERITYHNLVLGISPSEAGVYMNPYREWIGAQIRADTWGYVNPGNPKLASEYAWRDARLSHTANGIYGAMFVASMVSAAFTHSSTEEIVAIGLQFIPKQSRLYEAIKLVQRLYETENTWQEACISIHEKIGSYYSVSTGFHSAHVIPNACIVALALLFGEGEFEKSVSIAVMSGYDTDCNGATVGSIIGATIGSEKIPTNWVEPFNNTLESYIADNHTMSFMDLAKRFEKQINK